MIAGSGTDHNMIRRNTIGLDYLGTGGAHNGLHGVLIMNGASANTVGGEADFRNYTDANQEDGVSVSGANSNTVTHDCIGIDSTGSGFVNVGNVGSGVVLEGGAADKRCAGQRVRVFTAGRAGVPSRLPTRYPLCCAPTPICCAGASEAAACQR